MRALEANLAVIIALFSGLCLPLISPEELSSKPEQDPEQERKSDAE